MGNVIRVERSKTVKTKDGVRFLSECFYKYEDRNINLFTGKQDDEGTAGAKFWDKFWDLWKESHQFKTSLKKYGFGPTKRRVRDPLTGTYKEKWSLQINHWMPIPAGKAAEFDGETGHSDLEAIRNKVFDDCWEEIMPVLTKRCPEYVNDDYTAADDSPKSYEISYGFADV